MIQAYRFALEPTPRQARSLARHAGAARLAFNWGLAAVKANLSQREAELSYGLTGDELTPPLVWSLYSLRKAWNRAKNEAAPWWRECSKEAFNTGLDQLARSLKNWEGSRKGERAGRRMGFPRFKVKRACVPTVRFTTGAIRVDRDRRHVTLPRVGSVKTHESTRKLERKLAAGTARILSATCRFAQGRWFVAFTVETTRVVGAPRRPDNVSGMARNRKLARRIHGAGFGEIRQQLTYKMNWNGGRLVLADRWYPSSKVCSGCGTMKPKLSLSQRMFSCSDCGLVLDRDHNAARNLANLVQHVAGSGSETVNGRGADRETTPGAAGGCETSTPRPAMSGIRR